VWSPGIEQKSLSDFQKKSDVQLQRSGESDSVLLLVVRVFFYWKLQRGCCETWGAGVDIHTVDTRPSLFQFRNHFLVRFVPNELPLPCADHLISAWHLWYVTREPCTSNAVTDTYVQRSNDFLFLSFFDSGAHIFLYSWVSTPAPHISWLPPPPNQIYSQNRYAFSMLKLTKFPPPCVGLRILPHKLCHEEVHSARSSCTTPERVRKRFEFGWK